ncbi:MAG TPA: hypothetical protein VGY66_18840, partial [Gemmataceae bacterium]|nr:hypothetical protein [Gemmataceae bacterium]
DHHFFTRERSLCRNSQLPLACRARNALTGVATVGGHGLETDGATELDPHEGPPWQKPSPRME